MRAQAHPNISSSGFTLETFQLGREWTELDLDDEDVVRDLRAYVGSHVRLHPDDLGELEPLGLALDIRGRLVHADEAAATLAAEVQAAAEQEEAEARRRARKAAGGEPVREGVPEEEEPENEDGDDEPNDETEEPIAEAVGDGQAGTPPAKKRRRKKR